MHIGTFTREGTWEAAGRELPELAALGITVLEVMPVADFPGRFGWGYDGVDLFAPTRLYGTPDDFRRFVDRAHAVGLGVILDVVYNHIGPDGNYLKQFAEDYFTDRYKNEWGEALNFDGANAGPVREFFVANAGYWIDEFHLDGLRLDATQQIFDDSPDAHPGRHRPARARGSAAAGATLIVAENEPQEARLVRPPEQGGYGLDALWNDDFHHSAVVALTGRNEAYYTDYLGTPQEFISAVKWGFLYQGQRYPWQKKRRGTPALDLPPAAFVTFLENHDQVANSARGLRSHQLTSPGRLPRHDRAAAAGAGHADALPGPGVRRFEPVPLLRRPPAASWPQLVPQGRGPSSSRSSPAWPSRACRRRSPTPPTRRRSSAASSTLPSAQRHAEALRPAPRPAAAAARGSGVSRAAAARRGRRRARPRRRSCCASSATSGDDRLLLVNLGRDLHLDPAPEPLLAPPEDASGRSSGRARTRATAAAARRRRRRTTTGAFRATRPWCWSRSPGEPGA